jgi:hypothetical protein
MTAPIIALWYRLDIDWLWVIANGWLTRNVLRYFILVKGVHKDMHTFIIHPISYLLWCWVLLITYLMTNLHLLWLILYLEIMLRHTMYLSLNTHYIMIKLVATSFSHLLWKEISNLLWPIFEHDLFWSFPNQFAKMSINAKCQSSEVEQFLVTNAVHHTPLEEAICVGLYRISYHHCQAILALWPPWMNHMCRGCLGILLLHLQCLELMWSPLMVNCDVLYGFRHVLNGQLATKAHIYL